VLVHLCAGVEQSKSHSSNKTATFVSKLPQLVHMITGGLDLKKIKIVVQHLSYIVFLDCLVNT
jgi:hypothetical protein